MLDAVAAVILAAFIFAFGAIVGNGWGVDEAERDLLAGKYTALTVQTPAGECQQLWLEKELVEQRCGEARDGD